MAKGYSKETVMEAVKRSSGVMSAVARALNCKWETARKYVNEWPETVKAFEVESCGLIDTAVTSMRKAVESGERWAVERVLDTRGRKDGLGIISHSAIDHTTGGDKIDRVDVRFIQPETEKEKA